MNRRLDVQELESRIVPSAGLAGILNQLGLTGYGNPDGVLNPNHYPGAIHQNGFHVPPLEDTPTDGDQKSQ